MTVLIRKDTNLPIILYYIRKQLIDYGAYNATTTFIGTEPKFNLVPPDVSYCVITPIQQEIIDWETNSLMRGRIIVRLNFKLSVDIAMRADINLTQQSGIVKKINEVIVLLNLVDLTDSSQWILAQPMRYISQSEPFKEEEWTKIDIMFEVVYGNDPTVVSPVVSGGDEFTDGYDGSFT